MKLQFICGCEHDVTEEDIGWWKEVGTDRQGFLICCTHNSRRQGWRSLQPARDFSISQFSPLERERLNIFGQQPRVKSRGTSLDNTTPDRRDNRDPEEIGRVILAKENGK